MKNQYELLVEASKLKAELKRVSDALNALCSAKVYKDLHGPDDHYRKMKDIAWRDAMRVWRSGNTGNAGNK